MLDPQLQRKVIQSASEAMSRYEQVDIKAIWEILYSINPQNFLILMQSNALHYSYGAIPILEIPGMAKSSIANPCPVTGVDGSQIYPSPYHPVQWAYVQALAYSLDYNPPICETEFIDFEKTDSPNSDYRESQGINKKIDFLRTILELKLALRVQKEHPNHIILMDYPLIPWIDKSDPAHEEQTRLYVEMIGNLRGAPIAGIVSEPKSRLLINLIRLSQKIANKPSDFPDLSDSVIACEGLKPGQRSAIFTYAGSRNLIFQKYDIEIHFFFIRIGERDIVRVEIPSWVSSNSSTVDLIQASILKDSAALGYSYSLAMAHKGVSISMEIANMLHDVATKEYIARGGRIYTSAKMRAKGLTTQ